MTIRRAHTESAIKQALKSLQSEAIDRIRVEFSGGGDSGQIDSVQYYTGDQNVTGKYRDTWTYKDGKRVTTPAEKTLPTIKDWSREYGWLEDEDRYGYTTKLVEFSVDGVIENHVYRELDGSGVDWYNNEGGQGGYSFSYDEEEDKWTYEFYIDVNYIECVTEHTVGGTIDGEDEE